MHICFKWGGCFSNGEDLLKISFSKEEMMIIFFHSTDEEPPVLVVRFDASMPPWPNKKQPSYSVVKSNYRDNTFPSVLQKVEVIGALALHDQTNWKVTVAEYEVKADYYDQIPPDDSRKCCRTFNFALVGNELHLDHWEQDQLSRKSFVFERRSKSTDLDDVFSKLTDRRVDEGKASAVFQAFQREMWMINDSIIVEALTVVERDIEKKELMEQIQKRKSQSLSQQIKDVNLELKNEESEVERNMQKNELLEIVKRKTQSLSQQGKEEVDHELSNVEFEALITEEEQLESRWYQDELITEDEQWEMRNHEDDLITEDELIEGGNHKVNLMTTDEQWERREYEDFHSEGTTVEDVDNDVFTMNGEEVVENNGAD